MNNQENKVNDDSTSTVYYFIYLFIYYSFIPRLWWCKIEVLNYTEIIPGSGIIYFYLHCHTIHRSCSTTPGRISRISVNHLPTSSYISLQTFLLHCTTIVRLHFTANRPPTFHRTSSPYIFLQIFLLWQIAVCDFDVSRHQPVPFTPGTKTKRKEPTENWIKYGRIQ